MTTRTNALHNRAKAPAKPDTRPSPTKPVVLPSPDVPRPIKTKLPNPEACAPVCGDAVPDNLYTKE